MSTIYFDHNATTPLIPEALSAIQEALTTTWANPSSLHHPGVAARRRVETARMAIAEVLGASPTELMFTSGGTEANNHVLGGLSNVADSRALITSQVEHPSVLNPARLTPPGCGPRIELPVATTGAFNLDALETALREHPRALVSLMWANNETGVLFPMAEIAARVHAHGGLLHSDAVQALGRVAVNVRTVPVDLLTLSAHKFGGPKGIGVLYRKAGTPLPPLLRGGGQEQGLRAGTPNVPGILGMASACIRAAERLPEMQTRVRALRDRLEAELLAASPDARIAGAACPRLPNTSNLSFPQVAGDALLLHLDDAGIAVSSGAACSAGQARASHVLLAMGQSASQAGGAVRFSLGIDSTDAEVDQVVSTVLRLVHQLRGGAARRSR